MAAPYSIETICTLRERFQSTRVHRPMRVTRYEPGDLLHLPVTGVLPSRQATATVRIEKFVGGGFAGQVYRVFVDALAAEDGPIEGLEVGGPYAMKILIPPSRFSQAFRDAIYAVGFQAPFGLQSNPSAARAGALWQKFIRRAAGLRLGTQRAVVDILATFVDPGLGSCGELSEWVSGRTWRYEVDDHLDVRKRWARGQEVNAEQLGSPEYRSKKTFMADFVALLHEVGAHEFARQYEWWTSKSQPNALKRLDTEDDPETGLVAVDFRAGLALLPFLPMSPGDFALIGRGLKRGALVQFDRGDIPKLRAFVSAHPAHFEDMHTALDELEAADTAYRRSQLDLTRHHIRPLIDGELRRSILDASITGWQVSNLTDAETTANLRRRRGRAGLFALLGLVPFASLLASLAVLLHGLLGSSTRHIGTTLALSALAYVVPSTLARATRALWGREDTRRHWRAIFGGVGYLGRALRAHVIESATCWLRAGRIDDARALRFASQPWRYSLHRPFGLLPVGLHRMLTDGAYAKELLTTIFVRPLRLYFNADAREAWLREMVADGRRNHMLTDDDAERILSRIGEPFIQKYLKSLAVHVCTLPVTQVVSIAVAWYYVASHPELSTEQAAGAAAAILAAFQLTPISPGSIVRGLYVVYLVARERNLRDYNIAVFLGFFKYAGYLAFPIQMAYRYPVLARFMAGHWATGAVHVVPVFGERGALLEHWVFDLFYNRPLTVRRRMRERSQARSGQPERRWHAPALGAALGVLMLAAGWLTMRSHPDAAPTLRELWPAVLLAPLLVGGLTTAFAGGAALGRRILLGGKGGLVLAVIDLAGYLALALAAGVDLTAWTVSGALLWRLFLYGMLSTVAAVVVELSAPSPRT